MAASTPIILDNILGIDSSSNRWDVVIHDREKVISHLQLGECEGMMPDFWLEPDDLLHFAIELGAMDVFATFPDLRKRRNIPSTLIGKVLLAGTIPDKFSLREIGNTVYNSAALLDQLGFNYFHTREGGPRTGDERPFDVEAIGDFFANLTPNDYNTHALPLAIWLREQDGMAETTWAIDGLDVQIPKGRVPKDIIADSYHLKVMVLSILTEFGAMPLLWRFGTPHEGEIQLAKLLWADALTVFGPGACHELLADAGFIDGEWEKQLHAQGTTVIIRMRDNMDPFIAAQAYVTAHPEKKWRKVAIPKRPKGHELPRFREITGFCDWPGWEAFGQDLSLCLVRDRYANGEIDTWCLISTDPSANALQIYETFRKRWHIEEIFMALSRYHGLNSLPACRTGVACARIHTLLFAYTIRWLCFQQIEKRKTSTGAKLWRRRTQHFIMYAGGAFAIMKGSEVMEIIFSHNDAWLARKDEIITAIR